MTVLVTFSLHRNIAQGILAEDICQGFDRIKVRSREAFSYMISVEMCRTATPTSKVRLAPTEDDISMGVVVGLD